MWEKRFGNNSILDMRNRKVFRNERGKGGNMKFCKVLIGFLFVALIMMGAQSALASTTADSSVDASSDEYTTATGQTTTVIKAALNANPTATVAQLAKITDNSGTSGSAVGSAAAANVGGSVVSNLTARIDDNLSTMMAVYKQRKERMAARSMSQPAGPAGSGAAVGVNKIQKVWGRYSASFGEQDQISSMEGYDFVAHGPLFGYDRFVTDRLLIGGTLGYTRTDVDADGGGETDVNSYTFGVYGSYIFTDVDYLNVALAYTLGDINSDNTITGYGSLSGDTDSNTWLFAGEYGHKFLLKNTFILTPVVGFTVNMVDVDGYTAKGTNNYGDETYADKRSVFFSTRMGVKGDWLFSSAGTLKVKAMWLHEYSDDLASVTEVKYEGQTSFVEVKGIDPGRDKGLFGLGVKYAFQNGMVLDIDGDFTVGEEYKAWGAAGRLEYPF
ncbi:hypothetical protein EPICR_30196 [Candidatus Desulfarcum epimagneticum]|uniref:Autotransporter domain-containing protein n=1 Tax=uncultured Desulfobacteraceae bacterium TaxID=218296 RepID=A0A484HLV4_9BACT|nr:hypothetical protein EPICR_30196 [uncultured Desulfobacteraceae bacterium]